MPGLDIGAVLAFALAPVLVEQKII